MNLLELVEVKPDLSHFCKLSDDLYHHHSDTQQLLYLKDDKYYVQAASVLYLTNYQSIQEI